LRAVRTLVLLSLASCGGFLPFGRDDDDEPPAVPSSDAAADGSSDGSAAALADGAGDALVPVECRALKSACTLVSDCCSGLECRASSCCVSGGAYANAAADCCSGTGTFEGFSGWLCLDDS
jgi:hypothetical protein